MTAIVQYEKALCKQRTVEASHKRNMAPAMVVEAVEERTGHLLLHIHTARHAQRLGAFVTATCKA